MKPADNSSILPPPSSPPGSIDLMEDGKAGSDQPKRSLRTLLMNWAENTGMHGLPNITRNHSPAKKTFWTLLLLAGLGIMTWQIVVIVQKYYSYPIIVQRSIETLMPRPFPAVTICNLNPARKSKVTESFQRSNSTTTTMATTSTPGALANGTAGGPTTTASPDFSSLRTTQAPAQTASTNGSLLTSPASPIANTTKSPHGRRRKRSLPRESPPPPSEDKFSWMTGNIYNSSKTTKNLSALGPDAIPESLGVTYTFLDYYNSLTGTWKTEVGTQLNDFLIDCSVGNRYCRPENFSRFLHPLYGNCYTFNALRTDQSLVNVLQPGPLHGLKLTLFVDQTEYVGAVANSAGVNVVVHEPDRQPFPEDTGISVSPGQETYIGLREVYTKRLAYPYADECQKYYATANAENNMYSVVSNFSLPNVNYSKTACMKTCMQRKVEKRCNCSSPSLPISDPTVDPLYNSSYTICLYEYNSNSSSISTEAKCAQSAEKDAFSDCSTLCKQDCDEFNYMPSLSHSMWPSDAYESDSQQQIMSYSRSIKDAIEKLKNPADRKTFMSKNFVKVLVFYNDARRHMVVSVEGYLLMDVLSDMGGQVGLWLGLSVLTLFEIVEMFVDLGLLLCKKTRRPTKPADAWKWTAANAMMQAGEKPPLPTDPTGGELPAKKFGWYEGTEMSVRVNSARKIAFS